MKTRLNIVLVAGLFAVFSSSPSLAAKGKSSGKADDSHAEFRMGHAAKRLGLSEEQAKKLKETRKAVKEAVKPIHKKIKEEMKLLRRQVREEKGDKDIEATLDRIQKLRESMKAEREKQQGTIAAILTPSQRAKMLLAKGFNQGRGRQKMLRGRGRSHGGGWQGSEDYGPRRRRGGHDEGSGADGDHDDD